MLAVLALFALTVSCVDPLEPIPGNQSSIHGDALVFSPKVLGITPATKTTLGDADRGENTVTRLDVFVYKTTGGTSTFHKHYTIGDGSEAIETNIDYLLESNWRVNYTLTDTYRIYAIANINANKLNDPVLPASPSEVELLNLTSESDATITGQYGYTCYDIVRLKNLEGTTPAEAGSLDHHISDKLFLMDGKIDNWQINPSAAKQYFTKADASVTNSFDLSRAAAKFRVTLDFSDSFKSGLGTADDTGLKFTTVVEYQTKRDGNGDPVLDENDQEIQIPKTERIITIGTIAKDANGKVYANGVVTGGARAKFANILKATYDIAPPAEPSATTTPTAAQLTDFRDANLWDSQNFYEFSWRNPNGTYGTGEDEIKLYKYPYIDTTYSYAFGWEAGQAAEKAPALAVSIIYTTYIQKYDAQGNFDGEAESDGGLTNYYRIPLVDIQGAPEDQSTTPPTPARAPVYAVERNYYYQVDAYINTMGTSTTEIEPTKLNLKYKVIPWPDAPDEKTEAQTVQLLYFVPEKEYRLRGDDLQSVYLQYFVPKSDPISSGSSYFKATPKIKNVEVYYYDQDGQKRTLENSSAAFNASGGYSWESSASTNAGVTINVIPDEGRFYVASTALANRSVKYIEFDAEVDFSYAGGQSVTQHIIVTHFPLDNIQSIQGWWSSRWDQQPISGSTTTYYRKKFYKQELTPVSVTEAQWAAGVGNNNDERRNANSAANAVNGYYATGGSSSTQTYDPWGSTVTGISGYSWDGTRVTINVTQSTYGYTYNWSTSYNNFDYVISSVVNNGNAVTTLWKYSNYYHLESARVYSYSPTGPNGTWASPDGFDWEVCSQTEYNNSAPENRKVEVVPNAPGTGTWVAYSPTAKSGINQGTLYNGEGSGFYAKVWEESRDNYNIHRITTDGGWGDESNVAHDEVNGQELKHNAHMYVIQISKAEPGVIIGRPKIDGETHQSNDNVVSPAFMIASQLGAVSSSSYDASSAATHCYTYMEVSANGRRFVGWRLPTKAEIAYIAKYQSDEDIVGSGVFSYVLTGGYYYTLDNSSAPSNFPNADNDTFVRCIRDLTPEEVIELNNTGTITAASY